MMSKRFQIEDLIRQGQSGVLFHAVDKETGKAVALRRFFPFGASGGGLDAAEQAAYNIAVSRLATLRHPALRSVVGGACDPVDGIPFIVTEWIDGVPIGPLLQDGPLPPEVAAELLTQALEVCELLSELLAEEAVWVETHPDTIILGSEQSGRGFTFWISPLKWLGGNMQPRGLESIMVLTEQIMGWQGRIIGHQAGDGLGQWLKWLRAAAPHTSLREAREKLAASLGAGPPADARERLQLANFASQQATKPSMPRVAAITGLTLLLLAAIGWLWVWLGSKEYAIPTEDLKTPAAAESRVRENRPLPASEINEIAARLQAEAEASWQGGIFQSDQGELLARHEGRQVSLEGVVRQIGASKTGSTWYIQFSESPDRNDPCGAINAKSAVNGLDRPSLEALIGRRVRITGQLRITRAGGLQRPEIPIFEPAAITQIE